MLHGHTCRLPLKPRNCVCSAENPPQSQMNGTGRRAIACILLPWMSDQRATFSSFVSRWRVVVL